MRRHLAVFLAIAFLPSFAFAADDPKPNTLTAKEIEQGWILLFDGETTFGWKAEGDLKVEDGLIQLGGAKKSSIATTAAFQECEVRFDYLLNGIAGYSIAAGAQKFSDVPGDTGNWMEMQLDVEENSSVKGRLREKNQANTGASWRVGGSRKTPVAPIRFTLEEGSKLKLQSIKLKPEGARPLFNGKDLTGWKIFDDPKRNQSKWSVTPEGWLNVKNGPGDLQTEKQFDNFLLQFECISNGKALNSGVFFRCIPNEYQNGYEAQVQNGYKDNDRAKPADFGTGAIYRRVPARKVVSNDNEWFTMTVLANGNHISTWVNGYQTVDWIDDRPADNNPRKGSKTGAGHLSIQGHDPTTDLSFRNIRIIDLKSKGK